MGGTVSRLFSFTKGTVKFSGKALWVITSSALLLILPVLYENEMDAALENQEKQQMSQQQHLVFSHLCALTLIAVWFAWRAWRPCTFTKLRLISRNFCIPYTVLCSLSGYFRHIRASTCPVMFAFDIVLKTPKLLNRELLAAVL